MIEKLKNYWMKLLGYQKGFCPKCGKESWFKWHDAWLRTKERSVYGYYQCAECGIRSEILPTEMILDILHEQFGLTWKEFLEKGVLNER